MKETSAKKNKLGYESMGKLMFSMSIPAVLAQLVQMLYNVVDRVYVGRIEGAGSLALAGLGVTFPIILLVSAFAALVAMGGAPRAAIAMGRKDNKTAEKILGNSITLLVLLSVMLSVFFILTKEFILMRFGASVKTMPYASSYLTIYLLGTIFVMMSFGLNMFITNQGFAMTSMLTTCIGCGLNIILDPIFIFVFNMGVRGAALATIISQAVSAIWVLSFLLSGKSVLKIRVENLKLSIDIVFSILTLGISPFIMQATECLIQLVFNKGMMSYGNDMYVALMSIFFSLSQCIFLPISGFTQGAQPIIGFNFGAGNIERVKKAFKMLFSICISLSFIGVLTVEIFPAFFIGIFTPDKKLIDMGIIPLRIFLIGFSIFGAQCACQQTFVALGESIISLFLALLRKVFLLIPLALFLPKILDIGIYAVVLAEPISDIIAAITTTFMFKLRSRKLLQSVNRLS